VNCCTYCIWQARPTPKLNKTFCPVRRCLRPPQSVTVSSNFVLLLGWFQQAAQHALCGWTARLLDCQERRQWRESPGEAVCSLPLCCSGCCPPCKHRICVPAALALDTLHAISPYTCSMCSSDTQVWDWNAVSPWRQV
jgi:hypothetical protein